MSRLHNIIRRTYTQREMDCTADDEAIARAIAESEGMNIAAVANCPGNHRLNMFEVSPAQRVTCDACRRSLQARESVRSCCSCNYDLCDRCYNVGSPNNDPITVQGVPLADNSRMSTPSWNPAYSPSSAFSNHFAQSDAVPTHMCLIPCAIGDITVEMLVDTGAQSSVLSMPYVQQLGLVNRLDRRVMGVAAGVGRAKICGRIKNVVCVFGDGHVEFPMDFIVLDVSDPLVIIGLDQMRKYKCLVDMEREKLIFGGAGGVEVQMLPAEQQHFDVRMWNNSGCTVM